MEKRWVDRWWVSALLWVLAVVLMMGTAVYQRKTGPTHPATGMVAVEGTEVDYSLIRSANTGEDARIEVPDPGVPGTLLWRYYPTEDPWTEVPMAVEEGALVGLLPHQPAAGKLEYHVRLEAPGGPVALPLGETAVIRFKGAVPVGALLPHVLAMFFGILWGMRTVMEALANRRGLRWQMWTTLALLLVGGMFLGPVVQKYAFGAFWTGVPWGWDLTDNKTLVMVIGWVIAAALVGLRGEVKPAGRWAVVAGGLLMLVVYLIPHSMYGSQLDYDKVEEGVDPAEAIGHG